MSRKTSPNSDWAKLLQEAVETQTKRPVGSGWIKTDELGRIWNLGKTQAKAFRMQLFLDGKIERFAGVDKNVTGQLRPCVWWRIKK